jgi:hypothetical protein
MHKRYSGSISPLLRECLGFLRIDMILNLECYHRERICSFIMMVDPLSLYLQFKERHKDQNSIVV